MALNPWLAIVLTLPKFWRHIKPDSFRDMPSESGQVPQRDTSVTGRWGEIDFQSHGTLHEALPNVRTILLNSGILSAWRLS